MLPGSQANHISMTPVAAEPSDTTNMAPGISPDFWHQHGLQWLLGNTDINKDSDCSRVTDLDMILYCSLDLDVILALGVRRGHSDLHGPYVPA